MSSLLLRQLGLEVLVGVPVKPCQQVLVVGPPCKSIGALLLRFVIEQVFKLPPWMCQVGFSWRHEVSFWPGPVQYVLYIPTPFHHVRNCCGHGSFVPCLL